MVETVQVPGPILTLCPQRSLGLGRGAAGSIGSMHAKMSTVVGQVLDWNSMLPIFMRTYRESFTQDELDGMTAFYKTPAGQAVVKKMQQIQRETVQELKDLPAK
jgi:hypothetical protein